MMFWPFSSFNNILNRANIEWVEKVKNIRAD